jgi:integrase
MIHHDVSPARPCLPDAEIAQMRNETGREPMPRWTLHDLRRTGRSLMSRAKVPSDHAERVLGHVIGGVRETYDRYEYLDEKRDALTKLSNLLQEIISLPQTFHAAVESSAQLAAA